MRIVAGRYSSRKLITRPGNETRPTLDKVREAVFSSLGGFFDGGICLDLYAGSGAVGLEAISRGMDQAVFVDDSREAAAVIRQNIDSLQCGSQCRIFACRDRKALEILKSEKVQLNLVYLDPPYARQKLKEVLAFLDQNEMIVPGGTVVLETGREDQFHENYMHLYQYKEAEYGITRITYYRAFQEKK